MSMQDLTFFEKELRSSEMKKYVEILTGKNIDELAKEKTKKKVHENLEQLLKLLRVERLENEDKMKVEIDISNLKFDIRGYTSNDRLQFILHYTPHILDPLGTSFKWYSYHRDCISDGTLHAIAHLLYLQGFHEITDKYSFVLKLPTLTKEELKEYDNKFIDLWNS